MAIWTAITLPEDVRLLFKDAQDVAYALPDGSELPVMVEPVWCGRCGRVDNGERIETADVLDRMVAHRRQPPSIRHDPVADADFAAELRRRADAWKNDLRLLHSYPRAPDLERRRAWLSSPRSPPRCLQCGSTQIVAFPWSETMPDMPHPRGLAGCGWTRPASEITGATGHCGSRRRARRSPGRSRGPDGGGCRGEGRAAIVARAFGGRTPAGLIGPELAAERGSRHRVS